MVRRMKDRTLTQNTNMRGGQGTVTLSAALDADKGELHGKGRLFSTITLPPGASIGIHTHEKEMEAFCICAGRGRYTDNGLDVPVGPGDVTYVAPGGSHGIANDGDEDLILTALILFE